MSVNSYLSNLASTLVLKESELTSINTSISTINFRISNYFGPAISQHFKFGSSTRGTILPRKADGNSDIDYMVVFNTTNGTYKPQTYLNQLKKFAEHYYSTSEIRQSHPTIVLELNHIRFELVPAILDLGSRYQIPTHASNWNEWLFTDPNGFNQKLTNANTNNKSQIKPLVRLVKYWNALNGHLYSSFELENFIAELYYWNCYYLKDYFYSFWSSISYDRNTAQYAKDRIQKAKDKAVTICQYEQQGYESLAVSELAKLLPSI